MIFDEGRRRACLTSVVAITCEFCFAMVGFAPSLSESFARSLCPESNQVHPTALASSTI